MCVPKKKDQETIHEEDVQKEASWPSLRRPEYRPELLRVLLREGRSGSGLYSGLGSEPKMLQAGSQHQQGVEHARGDHGGKQGWVDSMGKKANPRNLDFTKKWSNRRNQEGEREEEYLSAKKIVLWALTQRRRVARTTRGKGQGRVEVGKGDEGREVGGGGGG
jgi:hypothetical protein